MRTKTLLTILICCVAMILTRGTASADEHEFRYKAPDATSVELMCEFNGWKSVAMTKGDDGVWTLTLDNVTYVLSHVPPFCTHYMGVITKLITRT